MVGEDSTSHEVSHFLSAYSTYANQLIHVEECTLHEENAPPYDGDELDPLISWLKMIAYAH